MAEMIQEEIQEVAIKINDQSENSTETNQGTTKLNGQDVAASVQELHILVKNKLGKLSGEPSDDRSVTILRLPGWIHENNKELCEPKMVAIGPYHHGKESLRTMEEHKWYTLRKFLSRQKRAGLEVYLKVLKSVEAQARNCYSETVDLESDDFVMMLILDGCFILEWFFKDSLGEDDAIFDVDWARDDLLADICLLENQIPYFVLHMLLTMGEHDVGWRPNCADGCSILKLFSIVLYSKFELTHFRQPQISCGDIDHLLHLCHTGAVPDLQPQILSEQKSSRTNIPKKYCGLSFLCSNLYPKPDEAESKSNEPSENGSKSSEPGGIESMGTEQMNTAVSSEENERSYVDLVYTGLTSIPCISELHDAGIKLKKKKMPMSMFDISFVKGTIEMPFIQLEPCRIRILWNMVAFEQSRNTPKTLSSYLALMDSLINTEKDISMLERSGIIVNFFQDAEEAATFFNQFNKNFMIDYDNHYFYNLFKDVKRYYESTWHRYRARLMHSYFSNPWSIISVVAAGALLILTFLQTYVSASSFF